MTKDQILRDLRKASAAREQADEARDLYAASVRELVVAARSAGIGPTEIARAARLSRQAVYEALKPS
jgi:hypothetical protein